MRSTIPPKDHHRPRVALPLLIPTCGEFIEIPLAFAVCVAIAVSSDP